MASGTRPSRSHVSAFEEVAVGEPAVIAAGGFSHGVEVAAQSWAVGLDVPPGVGEAQRAPRRMTTRCQAEMVVDGLDLGDVQDADRGVRGSGPPGETGVQVEPAVDVGVDHEPSKRLGPSNGREPHRPVRGRQRGRGVRPPRSSGPLQSAAEVVEVAVGLVHRGWGERVSPWRRRAWSSNQS